MNTGPLAPVDWRTGRSLVPVEAATDDDLAWLNQQDEVAGPHAAVYVRAGGPDDRSWLRMERIRS